LKTVTEAVRSVPLRSLLTGFLPAAAAFLLSGAALDGLYSPWALAAVSAAGVSWPGLSALLGAGLGAFLFLDFQAGLRHTAAAILIFCANTAFCTTRLYRRPVFRPVAAVLMTLLVQSAYLIQRQPRQWALCAAACTVLYAAAALLPSLSDANAPAVSRGQALFLLGLGLSLTAYGWSFSGFRVGGVLAAALLMAAAKCLSPASAAAAGAVAGLTMDLFTGDAVLLTAVCCGGMGAASAVRERGRLAVPLVYTAAAMAVYTLLDGPDPLPLLFQSVAGAGLYLLLPQRLPLRLAQQAPAPPAQPEATPAAAFRAVYDSFFTEVTPPRPENPAVLFDRAAEQVCAGCLLQRDCWQAHYNDTYNAFNDACPRLLRRGSACAEDFPLHFASRCLHFPQLLEALNDQLHQFLLRRAHRLQLEEAYQMARQQYAQMSEVLSPGMPVSAPPRFTCRTAIALRPKEGETLCGDQAASFEAGGAACLLLSDGMGSGEAAHREAAMTVRLLKQFLQAGVEPLPALKTLNTALLLRCREGAGFTTIDLLRLDRSTGEAALYKYGAAPSYLKKLGRVTRYGGAALPAGLEGADRQPDVIRFVLPPDGWLVMVSDGVIGGDGDEWLQDLLAGWGGGTPDALARRILTVSADHGGRSDDCAVLVLHRLRGEENGPAQV
jgi:hypothetical protein